MILFADRIDLSSLFQLVPFSLFLACSRSSIGFYRKIDEFTIADSSIFMGRICTAGGCDIIQFVRRWRTEANAHDGQHGSLKIESICASGLEIQMPREISMPAWLPPAVAAAYNRYIHRQRSSELKGEKKLGMVENSCNGVPYHKG